MSPEQPINSWNKAIVDYTSPVLCTPVTLFHQQVMRPIVNTWEDRAKDIGNMPKKFGKRSCVWFQRYPLQTDRYTDRHSHHNTSQPLMRV